MNGLVVETTTDLTPSAWREAGRQIAADRHGVARRASNQMWVVGDWLLRGEDQVFANLNRRRVRMLASEVTGYSRHTLTMAVSLARRFRPGGRVDGLTWWHHLLVAKLSETEQEAWLTRAAEEEWSVRTLRERLRDAAVIARKPPALRPERLVSELTRWRRSELPEPTVEELRRWWEREMAAGAGQG
ncbi:MAG: DUF1016 domain-containing protein [Chloroflexi bacterium]|nr:MAG: DUF1016 domain-containing protein [Chloroflexota bacterium]